MNIYLIIEDGDSFCIRAKTMAEAVHVCEGLYLKELEDDPDGGAKPSIDSEQKYYHEQILQSCSLIGELKN